MHKTTNCLFQDGECINKNNTSGCSICSSGGFPTNGAAYLPDMGMTCWEADAALRAITANDCLGVMSEYMYIDLEGICGCSSFGSRPTNSSVPTSGFVCSICGANGYIGSLEAMVTGNMTCGEFEQTVSQITSTSECMEVISQFAPDVPIACGCTYSTNDDNMNQFNNNNMNNNNNNVAVTDDAF
jgi:hypothetical protein